MFLYRVDKITVDRKFHSPEYRKFMLNETNFPEYFGNNDITKYIIFFYT